MGSIKNISSPISKETSSPISSQENQLTNFSPASLLIYQSVKVELDLVDIPLITEIEIDRQQNHYAFSETYLSRNYCEISGIKTEICIYLDKSSQFDQSLTMLFLLLR